MEEEKSINHQIKLKIIEKIKKERQKRGLPLDFEINENNIIVEKKSSNEITP